MVVIALAEVFELYPDGFVKGGVEEIPNVEPKPHQVVIPVVPRSGFPSLEPPHDRSTLRAPRGEGGRIRRKNSFFEGKDRSSEAIQKRRSPHEEAPMSGGPTAGQLESRGCEAMSRT